MKTNMLRNSVVLVTLLALGCDSSSGSSKSGGDRGDSGLTLDGQAANQPDAGSPPRDAPFAAADAPGSSVDAPSLAADAAQDSAPAYPDTGLSCGQTGASCLSAADCCGLGCISGVCGALACLSDGVTCTSGGQCCSTICGSNGICAALNPTCKTAGNACTTGAECCNQTCSANQQCASPGQVSYCAQTGDLCRNDGECCTGVCSIASGALAGTCASVSTSCSIDGTLCSGCGVCCSHFCGPYGSSDSRICQPASGCHVQGDLCRKDSDCCGGDATSGLPGAGLIKCEPDPTFGARIGTCGTPKASNCPNGASTCKNACNPEGNVCHYKQTLVCAGGLTNVRNDCCDCIASKECCQPDVTGIPRCNSLAACVPVGGHCSFSGECCNQEPCLPDPVTGSLTCGSACVPLGGTCSTNGDCCTGMVCQPTPGSVGGTCQSPVPQAAPDAGVPSDVPPLCGYYGQACSVSIPCCWDSCLNGSGLACTDADVACVCYTPE